MWYCTQAYKPTVLVQEYHTFYGGSFHLLCMTLFASCEAYVTASIRKTVVILHCLMLVFIPGTSAQENNFFPFQSLMVINLNFLISSLVNCCSNLIYAAYFCLDTYFQTSYLGCSTAEWRDCMWELGSFIFLLWELGDTRLAEVVTPITSQLAVLTHLNMLSFFSFTLNSMVVEYLLLCTAKPLNMS